MADEQIKGLTTSAPTGSGASSAASRNESEPAAAKPPAAAPVAAPPKADAEVPDGLTEEEFRAAREEYLRAWPLEAPEVR